MKKLLLFIISAFLLINNFHLASAFLPPGTGGGDFPPLPPPLPRGEDGRDNNGVQTDVLNPVVLFSSSSSDVPAGTQITINVNVVDSGGLNTGVSYFVLKENSRIIHTEQCHNSASCSKSLTFTRAKGAYQYKIDAYDSAGNKNIEETTNPDSITINFRNRNPSSVSLIYPQNNSYVLVSNPVLSWSSSLDPDGDSVTYDLEINGIAVSSNTNSYQPKLPEGLHKWRVRAKDSENALSEWTAIREFRVDSLYPKVINSNAPDVELGNDAIIQVDIIEENNLISVKVEINNILFNMSHKSGNTYSYILKSPPLGVYFVNYYATDETGKINSSVKDSFNVFDSLPPLIFASDQTTELGSDFSYAINATDLSIPIKISINNENFTIENRVITNNASLTRRDYTIPITASDSRNNTLTKNITISVVDTTSPLFSPIPSDRNVEAGRDFSYDIDAFDFQAITYSINDTRFNINSNGLIKNLTPLSVGNYHVNLIASDLDDNSASAIINIFVLDTLSPAWDDMPKNYTSEYGNQSNITVKATDFQSVRYLINDIINFAIDAIKGVITKVTNFLGVGTYDVQINATDNSGNVNTTSIIIEVKDTTNPSSFSLLSPANNTSSKNNTPTMMWSQTSDLLFDEYRLEIDNNSDFSSIDLTYNLKGLSNTSLQIILPKDGAFYWRVKAFDSSGNHKASETFIYSPDALPPSLAGISIAGHNDYRFSPKNLDGNYDNINLKFNASEPVLWDINIYDSSNSQVWHRWTNSHSFLIERVWDGQAQSGGYLADGIYNIRVTLEDRVGNIVNLTVRNITIDNTAPLYTSISQTISPVYGYTNVTLNATWPNTSRVLFEHNASGSWKNLTATKNRDVYSTIIPSNLLEGGEEISWKSHGFDDVLNRNNTDMQSFIVKNSPPFFNATLQNKTANVGRIFTYSLSNYVSDLDGDVLTFKDNASQFNIGLFNGIINFLPSVSENISINLTVCDSVDCIQGNFTITINPPFSHIVSSWLNGTYYFNLSSDNIPGVYSSDILYSNISEIVDIKSSYLKNSTLVNSTAELCTVVDSVLYGIICYNQFIDPSDVRYSNISGSNITNSHVWNSNATNSDIDNSTIDNSRIDSSTITNTVIFNTTIKNSTIESSYDLVNAVINNANITGSILYSGTIVMLNGTVYNANSQGSANLSALINLRPNAEFLYSTNHLIVTFTDISFDYNIFENNSLNDSITNHSWDFGDSSKSSSQNITHAYPSAGAYKVSLTVTDRYGLFNTKSKIITLSSAPSDSGGSSGGSSGGGGGGCLLKWDCGNWSECSPAGKQIRVCENKGSCSNSYKRPENARNCTYLPTQESEEETGEPDEKKGAIGITGKAIGNILEFGKDNLMFIAVLIAVIVLFIVISMKMGDEGKRLKRKSYKDSINNKISKIFNIIKNKMISATNLTKRISKRIKRAYEAARKEASIQREKKRNKSPFHHKIAAHIKKFINNFSKKKIKRKKRKK